MKITLEIPDDIAGQIVPLGSDPSRQVLKDVAVAAYQAHRITAAQLRTLLGISSRAELDALLKHKGVWLDYSVEDFRREGELTRSRLA